MSYSVIVISQFEKELKRLAKKYPSLKTEYIELVQSLKEKPKQGSSIGNHCYKIRLSVASKGKGKSGGARVIINLTIAKKIVYLLTIHDKSEKEDIPDKELVALVKQLPE